MPRRGISWGLLLLVGCGGVGGVEQGRPVIAPAEKPTAASRSSWTVFREEHLPKLKGWRWAVVVHRPTYTLVDSLLAAGLEVMRIYAPEHGLLGQKAAGEKVHDTTYRGVPVRSLYGAQKAPLPQELQEVEAILFALRDVGVRHYTYLSTLAYVLQAAAEAGRPVWVLDFPNPHAHYAYGPLLDSSLFSFVGLYPVPLVLGLTIGEYARLITGEGWVKAPSLHIVPWKGWRRGSPLPADTPFFAVPPSPSLRSLSAIELYPILGWYEGTTCVSVGRGTPFPFEQVGLRGASAWYRADTTLYGYRLEPATFQPEGEKISYYGWRIKKLYKGPVHPDSLFRLGFFLLRTFRQAYAMPEAFYQEEFFDKLFGTPLLRWMEAKDLPIDTLYKAFQAPASWEALRQKYRLYP
ncbi:MAG: DUF1343 domain-containing protein [Bacteroidia bacterium]|nr:DUF1343 domain-containing protein [Bacteroidia bacterium]GIV22423.1 MAG: hypothetical protein KatS3mg025_0082 [Bacteroidia bacterium]